MGFTIDIDTGGTFTDGFFVGQGRAETVKTPTTPHDLTVCFLDCIKKGAKRFGLPAEDLLVQTDIIRFSNTIGTNAIIQRDGSKVGLLVGPGLQHLAPTEAEDGGSPLVYPDMVRILDEETDPSGRVLLEPDSQAVLAQAQELVDQGARCLVVGLAHSEFNPENERLVRRIIKAEYPRDYLGSVPVFLSSDISRRSGQGERINAAVLNAYIHAKLVRLLYKAGEELRKKLYPKNLFIVHNNGAVARVARTRAINTYNSGPAAGLLGARLIGRIHEADHLISVDMGGTSFDIGYVRNGQPSYSLSPDIEGLSVNVPMLAIRAIGAGGGSIASVQDGKIKVGPQSAGALPGPVCFDLGGTRPTVTDADLVLGILDPDFFLGGAMKLNKAKAEQAISDHLSGPLGISVPEAALMVKKTVDQAMGQAVARLQQETGLDQSAPLLVVYGGAGPAHCCDLARETGLKKIVATPQSAVFSAFSSSTMDVGHLYYRRVDLPLNANGGLKSLEHPLAEMKEEARRDMRGEGFTWDQTEVFLELILADGDTGREIKIDLPEDFFLSPEGIAEASAKAAQALSLAGGTSGRDLTVTSVGLMVQAPAPHFPIESVPEASGHADQAVKGNRKVFLSDPEGQDWPVYDRTRLGRGHQVSGPALVESDHTTFLVPPAWRMTIDRFNHAILEEVD